MRAISNSTWKKIRKIQAISWNPAHIFYDLLATKFSSIPVVSRCIQKIGASGVNDELSKRNFSPVNPQKLIIEDFYASNGQQSCEELLKKYGVCLLPEFVPRDKAIAAGNEVKGMLDKFGFIDEKGLVKPPVESAKYGDEQDYEWQTELAKYKNYKQIVDSGKPVFNIRSQKDNEPDSGMVDIFMIEQLAREYNLAAMLECYQSIREELIDAFLTRISGYGVRQSNLYYNAGVTSTRGPHIDNNSEQYKIFIYLTDVLVEEDGPYCYVPGSHRKRNWMSKERVINSAKGFMSTEVSSFPREKATKLLAPAGTAIISCQSGIHFGWQQSEAGRRIVLIGNYN